MLFSFYACNSFAFSTIAPGIQYQQLFLSQYHPFSRMHVFKINPKHVSFNFCQRAKLDTFSKVSKKNHSPIVFNSGFFSKNHKPLGLRMSGGKVLNRLKRISWWGVFYIKNKRAYIKAFKNFHYQRGINFAIQAGPRLIDNGRLISLRPGTAERTALGITKAGDIILAITDSALITTRELAVILRDTLHCTYALNLDGGGSTQLYTNTPLLKLQVTGRNYVPDPICIHA